MCAHHLIDVVLTPSSPFSRQSDMVKAFLLDPAGIHPSELPCEWSMPELLPILRCRQVDPSADRQGNVNYHAWQVSSDSLLPWLSEVMTESLPSMTEPRDSISSHSTNRPTYNPRLCVGLEPCKIDTFHAQPHDGYNLMFTVRSPNVQGTWDAGQSAL